MGRGCHPLRRFVRQGWTSKGLVRIFAQHRPVNFHGNGQHGLTHHQDHELCASPRIGRSSLFISS